MMFVNKYKLRVSDVAVSGATFNIPIEMVFNTVDQAEIVETEFVQKEVEKAINPIVDYEKARFIPINGNNVPLKNLSYELNFLNGGVMNSPTYYSNIGFNNDDLKFRKSGFVRSFLRLNFYDNDTPSNQRLLSFLTIYSKVTKKDVIPIGAPDGGMPIGVNQFKVNFILNNPVTDPNGFAEGYYLYHYKDEVLDSMPKELFMRAEFNNAKTGKRTSFVTTNTPQSIDNIVSKLHTKYILKRDPTGFYYEIDNTYSGNVEYSTDINGDGVQNDSGIKIKLYEIQVT